MFALAILVLIVGLVLLGYAFLCASDPEGRAGVQAMRCGLSGSALALYGVGYLLWRAVVAFSAWVEVSPGAVVIGLGAAILVVGCGMLVAMLDTDVSDPFSLMPLAILGIVVALVGLAIAVVGIVLWAMA